MAETNEQRIDRCKVRVLEKWEDAKKSQWAVASACGGFAIDTAICPGDAKVGQWLEVTGILEQPFPTAGRVMRAGGVSHTTPSDEPVFDSSRVLVKAGDVLLLTANKNTDACIWKFKYPLADYCKRKKPELPWGCLESMVEWSNRELSAAAGESWMDGLFFGVKPRLHRDPKTGYGRAAHHFLEDVSKEAAKILQQRDEKKQVVTPPVKLPGGGLNCNEGSRAAALRELKEETKLELQESDLLGPVQVGDHRIYAAAVNMQFTSGAANINEHNILCTLDDLDRHNINDSVKQQIERALTLFPSSPLDSLGAVGEALPKEDEE